jgi:hypothetical protein
MKKLLTLIAATVALSFGTVHAASHAGAPMASGASGCAAQAADKKLAGAAKASFMKKCEADSASPASACEKTAADKKLAGAAKTSHLKKCMEDSKAADAKPMAAAKPAASAKK